MIRTTIFAAAAFAVVATVFAAPASASDAGVRNAKKWEHLHLNAYKAGNSGFIAYDDECRLMRVKVWDENEGAYFWARKTVC